MVVASGNGNNWDWEGDETPRRVVVQAALLAVHWPANSPPPRMYFLVSPAQSQPVSPRRGARLRSVSLGPERAIINRPQPTSRLTGSSSSSPSPVFTPGTLTLAARGGVPSPDRDPAPSPPPPSRPPVDPDEHASVQIQVCSDRIYATPPSAP